MLAITTTMMMSLSLVTNVISYMPVSLIVKEVKEIPLA